MDVTKIPRIRWIEKRRSYSIRASWSTSAADLDELGIVEVAMMGILGWRL